MCGSSADMFLNDNNNNEHYFFLHFCFCFIYHQLIIKQELCGSQEPNCDYFLFSFSLFRFYRILALALCPHRRLTPTLGVSLGQNLLFRLLNSLINGPTHLTPLANGYKLSATHTHVSFGFPVIFVRFVSTIPRRASTI